LAFHAGSPVLEEMVMAAELRLLVTYLLASAAIVTVVAVVMAIAGGVDVGQMHLLAGGGDWGG
jgi:hypothetical protein